MMLYSISRFRNEPILIIRLYPPLNYKKQIHAIDCDIIRIKEHMPEVLYRIDDLTRLEPHHFTHLDAQNWLTGDVREDAIWRTRLKHIAVANKGIRRYARQLQQTGHPLHVSIFPHMQAAIDDCCSNIAQQTAQD